MRFLHCHVIFLPFVTFYIELTVNIRFLHCPVIFLSFCHVLYRSHCNIYMRLLHCHASVLAMNVRATQLIRGATAAPTRPTRRRLQHTYTHTHRHTRKRKAQQIKERHETRLNTHTRKRDETHNYIQQKKKKA